MALITCPECGKEISDQAISCPNCGYVMKKEETAEPIAVGAEEHISQPPVKKYLLKTFLLWLLPVVEVALVGLFAGLSGINMSVLYGTLAINAILSGILLIKIVRAILAGKKRKSKVYRNVIAMVLCMCFLLLNGGLLLIDACMPFQSAKPDKAKIEKLNAFLTAQNEGGAYGDYDETSLVTLLAGDTSDEIYIMQVSNYGILRVHISAESGVKVAYSVDSGYTEVPFDAETCTLNTKLFNPPSNNLEDEFNVYFLTMLVDAGILLSKTGLDITLKDLGFPRWDAVV